jgi:UDP-glucose 4-epimerase
MSRSFLVTGGAGFIGSHIVEALVARGDRVRVLDNFSGGRRSNLAHLAGRVEVADGDLGDAALAARLVDGVECVFHEAALASVPRSVERPLDTHAACATGTLVLLDAARRAGVRRFVYAASSSAYGNNPFAANRETDLPGPLSPYAAAKLAGEHYCRAFFHSYGMETVCLRYFNVFGPRQDPTSAYSAVIPLFVTKMLKGERPTIFGDGGQTRDFTYVENVVAGNLLAAEAKNAAGLSINLANGRSSSLLDLVAAINRHLGTRLEPIYRPARAGDIRDSMADISLARSVLGYEPAVGFEEGLRRTIEHYRALA